MTNTLLATVQHSLNGKPLSFAQAEQFFTAVVKGDVEPVHLTALLVALKMRGETADEIAGAASALRAAATDFPQHFVDSIDCCGTGGDGSNTINISSTAAIVGAAMGLKVIKHGNRSVSSRSGSADLLEQLGVNIQMSPTQAASALEQSNCSFLFAPMYHAGIKHAMPVRNALKSRTLFNLLGPLVNPAAPDYQLLGVYDPKLCRVMAQALKQLGVKRAWVVHGSGCDEVALHGTTYVCELKDGELTEFSLTPDDFGVAVTPLAALAGGEPAENAAATLAILQGEGQSAHNAAVAINVAAMIKIAGMGDDLKINTQAVLELLSTNIAFTTLAKFKAVSQLKEPEHG
ncbi:anthranilate phosphoribosyltransferase [Rheinheimera baltica]|uniref:anthranilate phosphoribosyltransferase n=1 Tax=Rheinheimera baltica TaxID=67576 RepID=UPI00273D846E|nr:anthranilate phosphoribosyltransferase [Rheinheimera baltica]MDP5148451.1 anthranilate phosphoribosyltransferase [Rheinheimera baltica]MDP5188884.1 anthranilate phosphoribosyltransferase [Rheinheimera baltica]